MFIKVILSGPSVIDPRANKAEYLFFQSGDVILGDTKLIMGCITGLPIT
jgi:hypothetical protein